MKVERENPKASLHNKSFNWQKRPFYFRQVSVTVSAKHLRNDLSDWLSRSLLPLATLWPTMPIEILLSCVAEICFGESYESKSVLIELLARIIHLIAQ